MHAVQTDSAVLGTWGVSAALAVAGEAGSGVVAGRVVEAGSWAWAAAAWVAGALSAWGWLVMVLILGLLAAAAHVDGMVAAWARDLVAVVWTQLSEMPSYGGRLAGRLPARRRRVGRQGRRRW